MLARASAHSVAGSMPSARGRCKGGEPSHWVAVDELSREGKAAIRDPHGGTSNQMTQADFVENWTLYSVWRQ